MTALRRQEVDVLGRLYYHWESGGGGEPSYRELSQRFGSAGSTESEGRTFVDALVAKGLVVVEGDGDPDQLVPVITPVGIAWFERNVDYWRDCNQIRMQPLFDAPESDVSKSLAARLRDPVVPGAAAVGAAAASLLIWWFS